MTRRQDVTFRIGAYLHKELLKLECATGLPNPCPHLGEAFPSDHPCVDWLLENMPSDVVVYASQDHIRSFWLLSYRPDWKGIWVDAVVQYSMRPLEEFLSHDPF